MKSVFVCDFLRKSFKNSFCSDSDWPDPILEKNHGSGFGSHPKRQDQARKTDPARPAAALNFTPSIFNI